MIPNQNSKKNCCSRVQRPVALTNILLFAVPLGDVKRINVELSSKEPLEKWYSVLFLS